MFSVICSVYNRKMYENVLLPSFHRVNDYLRIHHHPPLQIIEVSGTHSMTENYNKGLAQSIYPIKFYIHEDVDLLDSINEMPLFFKIASLFEERPDVGIIGLVGTKKIGRGFWWEEYGRDIIQGRILTREEHICAVWNVDFKYTEVEAVDGFFIASNIDIPWNEDIKKFHFYDVDYCNNARLNNNKKILVYNHLSYHYSDGDGAYTEEAQILKDYYNRKWFQN